MVVLKLSPDGRPVTYVEPPSPRSMRVWSELRALPGSADLLRTLSVHRINVRYKRSRLGILWAMLQPLAMMVVFTLVFGYSAARRRKAFRIPCSRKRACCCGRHFPAACRRRPLHLPRTRRS
jgi:hypothetical protein